MATACLMTAYIKKEDHSRALIFYKKMDSVSKLFTDFDGRLINLL